MKSAALTVAFLLESWQYFNLALICVSNISLAFETAFTLSCKISTLLAPFVTIAQRHIVIDTNFLSTNDYLAVIGNLDSNGILTAIFI